MAEADVHRFDVVVVGGGHAGCEAAAAAARCGASTALVTFRADRLGAMSCNPAIGGLGKGHLVREVDACDGLIARAADAAAIHYRMLNRSKGSAVHGPRVQADRTRFAAAVQAMLAAQPDLSVIEGEATALEFEGKAVSGVILSNGRVLRAAAVVLATGTFLGGRLFRGEHAEEGGRIGEASAALLAQQLRSRRLPISRLKTGTPPRIDGRTIDWARLERQPGDTEPWSMSALGSGRICPQLACFITRTNGRTHDMIRANLHRSPLFSGAIGAAGPRYCPSIEDKIHRFGDRDGHQVFLEPEGLDTPLVYPNGISTSLPADVQQAMVRTMAGLEAADIAVPGYAVQYDHIDPRALGPDLQLSAIPGLFCAGQINGTTGYEEAAAQGLVAGLGAAFRAGGGRFGGFDRSSSYIGVMVDDLVLQGVSEPYRMLTARAEYRLRLRAGNAATRLTDTAIGWGCVSGERRTWFAQRQQRRESLAARGRQAVTAADWQALGLSVRQDGGRMAVADWARAEGMTEAGWIAWHMPLDALDREVLAELFEDARYAPYLARQAREVTELRRDEAIAIPGDIDFSSIAGLSREMVERLSLARPTTIAAAQRVPGVTPAALTAIHAATMRRTRTA